MAPLRKDRIRHAELKLREPKAATKQVGENCLDAGHVKLHVKASAVSPANEKH
jgi:hypothetical protein